MTESTTLDDHLSSQVVRTDPVTESEVLEVLTTHFIENSESLVKELGLKSRITVNDFTPRPHQLKLLTEVINSIITKGTKTFVINAPTGSGKSYLGVAITILLDYYNISKITPISKSLLLTFRNNLFEQYLDSYKYVFSIMGKSNYTCLQDQSKIDGNTLCIKSSSSECWSRMLCEYYLQRSNYFKSKIILTNYNWYMYNFIKLVKGFVGTIIMDEVHTLVDIIDEIVNYKPETIHNKVTSYWDKLRNRDKSLPEYNKSQLNYFINNRDVGLAIDYLGGVREVVYSSGLLVNEIQDYQDSLELLGLSAISDEFMIPKHLSKIDRIKHVYRKLMNDGNNHGKIKILLSATISEDQYKTYYHTDGDDYEYIHIDPIFKEENRLVYTTSKLGNVNYDNLKDPVFTDEWSNTILKICNSHIDDKGFIYCNSYSQVQLIKSFIHGLKDYQLYDRFIFNTSASNTTSSLNKFLKDTSNKVLISPVIKEGYDFKDDISRFQIITKIPYIHHSAIKEYGKDYYYNKTVVSLLQILGRSIRNENDYAKSYIIDGSYKMLLPYLPKWFKSSMRGN